MTDEQAHGDVVGMGMVENEIARLEQALVEKDRKLKDYMSAVDADQRVAEQQWDELIDNLAEQDRKYRQLMAQAVRFAQYVFTTSNLYSQNPVYEEAQTFLKEHQS